MSFLHQNRQHLTRSKITTESCISVHYQINVSEAALSLQEMFRGLETLEISYQHYLLTIKLSIVISFTDSAKEKHSIVCFGSMRS